MPRLVTLRSFLALVISVTMVLSLAYLHDPTVLPVALPTPSSLARKHPSRPAHPLPHLKKLAQRPARNSNSTNAKHPHLVQTTYPSIFHLPSSKRSLLLENPLPLPFSYDAQHAVSEPFNLASVDRLTDCLTDELSCDPPSSGTVVLLEAEYFVRHLWGQNDGEVIWAKSVMEALIEVGYAVFMTRGREETRRMYEELGEAVAVVIVTRTELEKCGGRGRQEEGGKRGGTPQRPGVDARWDGCLDERDELDGIPIYKILSMFFFHDQGDSHPLGAEWTMSPEPWTEDRLYIGYSVEDPCLSYDVIPAEERANRAWILAKHHHYFRPIQAMFEPKSFPAINAHLSTPNLPFHFAGGWKVHFEEEATLSVEETAMEGVQNLGFLTRDAFMKAVGASKVLVGMGDPVHSPTPYEALCLGVPFINPIRAHDPSQPANRSRWQLQHQPLFDLDPPFVYHVHKNDAQGLEHAIEYAINHPIGRTVLPRMRQSEVTRRVKAMVETDWKEKWERRMGSV